MTYPILSSSAIGLARAIREREVSARDVVEAHIEVLQRGAARINAIAAERYDAARDEADAADALIAGGKQDLPPLLGVPCTIKESIHVAGMPNCAGLLARKDFRCSENAPVVARLFDAGAIPLGVTNTSELTMWIESSNRVYGRTSNPYDTSRAAGGSSGGEGAAVGSGGSPFGIGSDIGGSIRIPAFFCGVFGHKPSQGIVPLTGAFPATDRELSASILVNGPLARRAEDLMAILRVVAGPDGRDLQLLQAPQLGDPASVSLKGMQVLVSDAAFLTPISGELLAAREQAAGALRSAGARIERIELRKFKRAAEAYFTMLSDAGLGRLADTLHEGGAQPLDLRSMMSPGGPHTPALKLAALVDRHSPRSLPKRAQKAIEWGRELARELAAEIGDGVLLHPPFGRVAPRHGRTVGRVFAIAPTAIFNLTRTPVTQVPLGLNRGGLPLGVQVVAAPGNDHVSIAVALELERVFGGWVPPPNV